jgi:hypothetical protein
MTTAGRALSLLLCLALAATGCGGDDETGGGPAGDPPSALVPSALVTGTTVDAEAAEQLLTEFDALDDATQELRAADADLELERATWAISGLDEAVGTERADEVFDSVNAGVRVDLAAIGAQLGGIEAFGAGAPSRLDELSEAQGASLFGAVMISSLGADAAAGLVDGVHTGSGTTPEGVTMSATKDTGTLSMQVTKTIDGVEVSIGTTVKIAPCPDANGKALAEGSMNASASKGGVGHQFSYAAKVEIQVGDDAEIASTTESFTAEQGDVSGGKEQYVAVSVDSEGNHDVTQTRGDLPANYTQQAVNGAMIMSRLLASRLVRAAEERWKSGRCVKLEPTVSEGPSGVRPGASITITAAPRSAIDGGPVGGTVTARLSAGAAGVEPSGTKVKADATFTYTAPPEAQQTGEVALEARSKRGVAKASVRFDTYPLSFVAEGGGGDFRGSGVICDLREPFTISGSGLTLSFTPTDRAGGSYTISGKAGGAAWSGGGQYKIRLNSAANAGKLRTRGLNTITTPLGTYSDTAVAAFDLRFVRACD